MGNAVRAHNARNAATDERLRYTVMPLFRTSDIRNPPSVRLWPIAAGQIADIDDF